MSTTLRFPLPHAAVFVGALRRSLNVSLSPAKRENGRKLLRNKRPLVATDVLDDLIKRIILNGYFLDDGSAEDISALLRDALLSAIARWQRVVGRAGVLPGERDEAAPRYLRLAAIDFAIRAAAFDVLTNVPSAPAALEDHEEVPVWARHEIRELIRKLPRALGATRAALTKRKALDDLFSGRHRPSPHTIHTLAKLLALKDPEKTPAASWRIHLLWLFALDDLTKNLAKVVGAAVVAEVGRAFRRIRRHARNHLASASVGREGLRMIVVRGAIAAPAVRVDNELSLIDALTRNEYASLMEKVSKHQDESELRRHIVCSADLRAASTDWLVSELSKFISYEPIDPVGVPDDAFAPLHAAFTTTNLNGLTNLIDKHPSLGLWVARTLIQQAFIRGDVRPIVGMVARFAEVTDSPALHFEAGIVHAAAGLHDDALRYFHAIGGAEPFATWAMSVRAVSLILSGRHADGLETIDEIHGDDPTVAFLRGLALYGLGQIDDALTAFESVIDKVPDHVDALAAAAECCDELSKHARGDVRRRWSIARNRYRKRAAHLGLVPNHACRALRRDSA